MLYKQTYNAIKKSAEANGLDIEPRDLEEGVLSARDPIPSAGVKLSSLMNKL